MSQSDTIPAVISLLSSDDDAGPSKTQASSSKDKPKKKITRKKRAPGKKTKNAKNLSSKSATGKTDEKAEQLKHNDLGNSKTLIKTVPFPASPAKKPLIEDKDGILKQFEALSAAQKRESPLRSAVKVRKPKAPTIRSRSMLKDMTDFGTSGASVSSTENENTEENDKPSEYAKLFADDDVQEIVSSSLCSDSGDVSDMMFESIFNEKYPPTKESLTFHPSDHYTSPVSDAKSKSSSNPMASNVSTMSPLPLSKKSTLPDSSSTPSKPQRRLITITNSPEGSPIDLLSSPESDSTPGSANAQKKTPESKTRKYVDSPKKTENIPLRSALKRPGEQRKTMTCSIPGLPEFSLPETKKKRKISLDEYKAKNKGTSQKNSSKNPGTNSLPAKTAETRDKMPSFYETDDDLETPTSSSKNAKKDSPPKSAIDHFRNYNSYKIPTEPQPFTPIVPKASEVPVANLVEKKDLPAQINGDATSGKDRRRKSSRQDEKKGEKATQKDAANLPAPRRSPRKKAQVTSTSASAKSSLNNLSCLKRPKKSPVQKAIDASISAQGNAVTRTTDSGKTAELVETSPIKAKPNVNNESSEQINNAKIKRRSKGASRSLDMSEDSVSLKSPRAANNDDQEDPPKKKSRPRVELQTAAYRQSHPTPVVDLLSSPKKDVVVPPKTTSASSAESKSSPPKAQADKIADNANEKSMSASTSSNQEVIKSNKRPKLILSTSPEGELVSRGGSSAARKSQGKQKEKPIDKGCSSTVIPPTTPQKSTLSSSEPSLTPKRSVLQKSSEKEAKNKNPDEPIFTSVLDELEEDDVESAPIDFGSSLSKEPQIQVKASEVPIATVQSQSPSSQNKPPATPTPVTPAGPRTQAEKVKEKPINLRVQQIAEEEEEYKEPDSIDDDLPLEVFVEKRDNKKQAKKKLSVPEENKQREKNTKSDDKENRGIKKTNASEVFLENNVSKSNEKSKNMSAKTPATKTSVAKTLPSKPKKQKSDGENKTRKKEKRRSSTTPKNGLAKTPQKSAPSGRPQTEVVNAGTILDSDEERELEESKRMTEMFIKIKQEKGLSFSQDIERTRAAIGESSSNQEGPTSDPAASNSDTSGFKPDPSNSGDDKAFKELQKKVDDFGGKFDARSESETPGFLPMFQKGDIPACKSTKKDKKYFDDLVANPQLLSEHKATESFYKGEDYSIEIPNEKHDQVLRAKLQKEFDVVEVERNKRKEKFGYYEDRNFQPGSADEKEMKKARDAFIEIDQKYASLDAELNGPPVLKDLQLEACKETDDNLFMMRKTVPFMAPYRYDNNEVKKAHYQQWRKDESGKYKPRKMEIERDSKLWDPAKSIVAGRRHCQRGNEIEDGHTNLMTSSYSTINSKISQLISWKKNDLKEKFDQMFPEPSYDPGVLLRSASKPVENPLPPATNEGAEKKKDDIKDEDPPGFSSDEDDKPEDNKIRAKVTFNNPQTPQTSRVTADMSISPLSPAIVPPVRKESRSKSLGSVNITREVNLEEDPERRKSFSVDSARNVNFTQRPGEVQITFTNADDKPSSSTLECEDLVVVDNLHKHRQVTVSKKTFVKGADLSIKK